MYNLADVLWRMNLLSEARRVHSELLEIRLARFGPDHPDTLASKAGW